MKLTVHSLSSAGPVRQKNEDSLGFWEPEDEEEKITRGAIAIIADGVGGHGNGDIASKLAVEIALQKFRESDPSTPAKKILGDIFNAANAALYDKGMTDRNGKTMRMATTMNVCIFREKEVHIGHVGDSRIYLVRHEEIQKLTNDHSMTGMQLKLRLITDIEARESHMRAMLTRSVGPEPIVRFDYKNLPALSHDRFFQCTDGLYAFMHDEEILEGVDRLDPNEICPYLVALAERRGTDDNLSAQMIQVDRVDITRYHKPLSFVGHMSATPQPMNNNELQPGQILDNRFRIESVVNRSGMATIFKAQDERENRTVALKIPHMQFESDAGFFSRFEREAEIGKKLDHPNILRFYEVEKTSRPYIVMEMLEGKTLAQILQEVKPLPISDAVQIAARIADALAHMHERKVVHRDLKPQNVMICNDGTLRIMDFGIAKAAEMKRLTFVGFTPAMGTPDYMAPEQVKGKRGDARTDIYSLGAILYEMIVGVPPFEADNPFMVMNARLSGDPPAPRKRNPEIPEEIEEIILHALARDPDDRYQSAAKMKADLENPENVKVTDRAKKLKAPSAWKARWHSMRLGVFSALIPIVLFALLFVFTRCSHGHH